MRLAEGGDMEKHLSEIQDLVDKLAALGQILEENLHVAMILGSLPESYNSMITALDTRSDAELTLALVQNILLNYFQRRQGNELADNSNVQAMKVNNSGIKCFFCHQRGHKKFKCQKWRNQRPKRRMFTATKAAEDNDETVNYTTQAYCAYSASRGVGAREVNTGQFGR